MYRTKSREGRETRLFPKKAGFLSSIIFFVLYTGIFIKKVLICDKIIITLKPKRPKNRWHHLLGRIFEELLTFCQTNRSLSAKAEKEPESKNIKLKSEPPVAGLIGAGNFTGQVILPALRKTGIRLKTIASGGEKKLCEKKNYGLTHGRRRKAHWKR